DQIHSCSIKADGACPSDALQLIAIVLINRVVRRYVFRQRPGFTGRIEAYAARAECLQRLGIAAGVRMTPRRLNRRTQRRRFGTGGADHRGVHDVGHDLPPDSTFGAATDEANVIAFDAAVTQQIKAVTQTEGGAFDHRAAQVGLVKIGAVQTQYAAGGVGQGGHALAVEERQHEHTLSADGGGRNGRIERADVQRKQFAHRAGGVGQVHGADQRQPAARRGTEGRHRGLAVDIAFFGEGVDRARRAQAHGDRPRRDIAGADRAHHVVATATGNDGIRVQAQPLGDGRQDFADRLMRLDQLRQSLDQSPAGVNVLKNLQVPLAGADVEVTGARRVAEFAAAAPGQPVVEVIVGQQNPVDAGEQLGKPFLAPEQFGDRVARRDGDTEALQRPRFTAQIGQQLIVFRGRFGHLAADRVQNNRLGALSAAIDAEKHVHLFTLSSDGFRQQVFQGFADAQLLQAVQVVLERCHELGRLWNRRAEYLFHFQQALGDQHVICHQRLAKVGAWIDDGVGHAVLPGEVAVAVALQVQRPGSDHQRSAVHVAAVEDQAVDRRHGEFREFRRAVGAHAFKLVGNRLVGETVNQRLLVLGQVDAWHRCQLRGNVQAHVGANVVHEQRVVHGFVNEPIALQRAQVGQCQVAAVEQLDLHLLVRRDVVGKLHADLFPGRAAVDEFVFQHPLHEGFADHRPGIVDAFLVMQLQAVGAAGHGRDAVNHGVGEADVFGDPVMQLRVTQLGESQQRLAGDGAVVRQVIAGHQGEGWRAFGATPGQCRAQITEHGFRGGGVLEVVLDLRQMAHELASAVVDAVAAFGDGQRNNADVCAGELVDECDVTVGGHEHLAHGADDAGLGVRRVAQFEQRVEKILSLQRLEVAAVFLAQADPADGPLQPFGGVVAGAQGHQRVGVKGLMRAVKAADANVHNALAPLIDKGSGGGLQRSADDLPLSVEQVAVRAVQVQFQCFAILAGQVAAYAHGQRFAGGGAHVAVGVAAQTLADVGNHRQLAIAFVGQFKVLGTDTQSNRIADALLRVGEGQQHFRAGVEGDFTGRRFDAADGALEKAHLRRAEEPCDEQVGRVMIKLQRRPDLFDATAVEHDHLVGQGHGFDLIVGDVDHRCLQLLVQARQFQSGLNAQGSVKVGQRFIEQEDFRVAHDGATDGYALALTARQLLGLAFKQRAEFENARGFVDLFLDFILGRTGEVQREGQVFADGHVRVQGVGLKHHRQVALGRSDLGDLAAIKLDTAAGDVFQAGDQAQQGGFAAARRANENHELAVFHVQVDAFDDLVAIEAFLQISDCQVSHDGLQFLFFGMP
nr:hypothetical protein [Tanacetum cinerariifolium]